MAYRTEDQCSRSVDAWYSFRNEEKSMSKPHNECHYLFICLKLF